MVEVVCVEQPQASWEERSMKHYAGLDVSVKETSLCIVARKILQEKALAIENDIRGLLRNFGLKVGIVGVVGFEQRIHDLVEGVPELADIMEPLLAARRVLREKFAKLHRKVLLLYEAAQVMLTRLQK